MARRYNEVMALGREKALVRHDDPHERRLTLLAADMLDREIDQAFNMVRTHAIFCTSLLPVRQIPNKNEEWVKHNGAGAKLMIQPTKDIDRHYHGVPFGSYGRLVLIWLQTEAVRTHTPRIHLGSSMHEWLGRMNIRQSGRSYQLVRN